jgi:Bacterial Ig domain/Putative Ig domain/Immunoglobulin domain/Immunoglobulin I-set domain
MGDTVNRWGKASLAILLALSAAACTAMVSHVNGNGSAAPIAPSIATQPVNQTVTAGQTATFAVTANGTAPLTYQWLKNGANLTGATSAAYTTPAAASSDNGSKFDVVVTNSAGTVTSSSAMLTVNAAATAPSITTQPVNQSVTAGQTATFSVTASGTAPLTYQWNKNGAAISGATASSYTTPATTSSDNGAQFTVVVSNASGSATSNAATLAVNASSSTLQITTSQIPGATLSGAYIATLAASGGTTPYSWSLSSGSLPTGLSLSSSGSLSGTPAVLGSFPFTVQVNDAAGHTASSNFSINVVNPVPSVSISSPANGATVSGTVYVSGTASDTVSISSVQLSVDNGAYSNASGTTSWSYSLNTASLSNGSHTLTAKTTDLAGLAASSSPVSVTVSNGSTATDCTLFASPSGNDGNSGSSSSAPKTFNGAASASQPGSVVCLLAGTYNLGSTFYPPVSGTPSSWIVYKSYGNGAVNFVWTAGATAQPMFKFGNGSFPSGPAYLEFRGLNLDGQNNALDGFLCQGGHHLRFLSNSINNTGGSGVGAVDCDYLTSDHNLINHNGYLYGWTSAISYNSAQWFDNYAGFHNIVSNNIITGEFDGSSNHSDGNGIILDLSNGSYNYSSANTPPALIINNVVYGNGGRCIQANVVTNFYIINNTCYKNDLDTSLGNVGSFTSQNSMNGYFINNITVAAASNNPSYDQESSNSNIQYFADMYYGAPINFSYSDPTQLINANPLFLNPPSLNIGGYSSSLAPALLGTGLTLQPSSPAYSRGIDPSTLSGLPSSIVSDLKSYIYVDINGKARPQGSGSDLGAYQH